MNKKGDKEDAVIILPSVRAQTTLLSFKQAMERFVFEDCDVRIAVLEMREARNIFQLVDASELLEFFYDDESETAILRCLACFKLHLASKPTLSSLTPFQAQRILNSSSTTSSGRLGSRIILKQETTRLLVNGQNQTWYRQKKLASTICACLGMVRNCTRMAWRCIDVKIRPMRKKHQQPRTSSAPPYRISNLEQLPFILRRCYPYWKYRSQP